ncbi:pilus assembly protein TadG-related protein [Roseomonas sp. BN140053]|uniref:pilus assembly protein TadG-related protein n=1 Tax=Roseomonas sp. BN140053 TaxID=3391898 RepID=UPI0039E96C0C
MFQRLLGTAGHVLRNRRGNVAAVVAVSGSVLIGMAGLATEGGRYYLALQDTQNAADVSAMAAASAYLFRGRAAALAAGREVAGRNGFATVEVMVNSPPTSGAMVGKLDAFEVQIRRQVPIILSRTFLGRDAVQASGRAVSLLYGTTPVCILALTGTLTVHDSSSFSAPGCAVGSNAPGASVAIPQSNSSVVARAVMSFGTCSGCNNTRWRFAEGYQEHAPPVSNPYERLDSKAFTTATGASCLTMLPTVVTAAIQPTGMSKAYCASVTVSNTSAVTFTPGTYVFQSTLSQVASLNIRSISSFTCDGCTFIFRGTVPGSLSIGQTSRVSISAPASNGDDSDYDGVLVHRARTAFNGTSSAPDLSIQGVSSASLAGGIYAPSSYVKIGQLSSSSSTGCLALVGGTLDISGLSSFGFDVSNCTNYRTSVPAARVVRLVE